MRFDVVIQSSNIASDVEITSVYNSMALDILLGNIDIDVNTVDNIGQFSIAIGNLIKGDSGKSPYIDNTTKTWWVYNDTTKQYEDTGTSVIDFLKKDGSIPLNSGYLPTIPLGIATKDYVDKQLGSSIEQTALNSYINTANTLSYSPPITDITIPIVLPYNTPITKRLTFTVGEAGMWSKISTYTFIANITGASTNPLAKYNVTLKYYLGATLLRQSTRLNITGEDFNYINQSLDTLVQQTNLSYSATDSFYLDIIITATTAQAATTLNILSYVNAPATFNRIGGAISSNDVFETIGGVPKTQATINSEKLDKANVAIYNITNEIPLETGNYYTLATAIVAIPSNIKKLDLKITFQSSATNSETWEFFNGTISNFSNTTYWRKIVNSSDLDLKIDKSSITDQLGTSKTKVVSQYGVSDAIMKSYLYDRNQLAYAVRQNLAGTGDLERVGNLSLHKTLPISSNARNCVKDATGVKYYLSNTSDFFKEDGVTPSILDGTDGDVMKEVPEFYVLEETVNNYAYTWLSEFPLPGFKRIPKTYHGLYEGSYNTTTGQTRSVINTGANYRLGLPATGQTRQYYNNGAKLNRNINWTIDRILTNYVRELLFRVDYATYNCQAPYNSQLTAEGYRQGGLGAGVTTLDGRWEWNGYNPFIPCGYTAELGNRTGVKDFTMPYAYEAQNTTTHVNWYKGIYNAATIYNVGEYVADMEDTSIGLGNGKLYKCIQQTTAGTPLTNTAYFTQQTRTVIQVNRYLVEIPFGHIHKNTIDPIVELTENYTIAKCYIYDNPANFADTKTANARYLCDMPATNGYIKSFNKYTSIPSSIGGSSSSWGCDYFFIKNDTAGTLRGLLVGGYAPDGARAGFGYSNSYSSPASANANFGFRLCCIEENIIL